MHARMKVARGISVAVTAALLGGATLMGMTPAYAAPTFVLPPKDACEAQGFSLGVEFVGEAPEIREFFDKKGNKVREIQAGRGRTIVYTNETTPTADDTITVKTPGSVTRREFNSDGSYTAYATGFNGLILTSGDEGDPSAKHYKGRLVYTVSADEVFEFVSFRGQERDICAELDSLA
ncbi:Uncharacterised protein [Kocuria rosea]|nr:Uncharacterised protein [Kocuria rosea]